MIHLQRAKVISPNSQYHGKLCDLIIDGGKISRISEREIPHSGGRLITSPELHVSLGWFDLGTFVGDPGYEFKEDIDSALEAAQNGGFTGIAPMPDSDPVRDNKAAIKYILERSAKHLVDVAPIGAVSKGTEGAELAELFDMMEAGVVAFSDGLHDFNNAELQKLALLYTSEFDCTILSHPLDEKMANEGLMHEGPMSTSLGLRGIPSLAEELSVIRDLKLAEYTEQGVHFFCLSSKESVERIVELKNKKVSSSVAIANLVYNDSILESFDTNFKVKPPIRSEEDRKFLLKMLRERKIQVLCTNHRPHEIEAKRCEFENAENGMAGLESFLPMLLSVVKASELDKVIERFTIAPRVLLHQNLPMIEEGLEANLTVFDPSLDFEPKYKSRAVNYPKMEGKKGVVLGVINGRKNSF